jgi:NAD(P)-dependent dehydrogenase (short-subunit alcohol dehydrogenase family)
MKRVVITGAGHGLGAALAHRFADAGAAVALLDVDAAAVEAGAHALAARGATALGLGCDVTSPEACRDAMARVESAWAGLDVLVNNAGITHVGLIRDTDVEVIRRVVEINFFGAVNCTRAALPMLLRDQGQVVAISSVAGFAPLANRAGYVASKHALQGFFATLRAEHAADGLAVSLVCPSFVRTGIGKRALRADGSSAEGDARTGTGHEVDPDEAAAVIHRGVEAGRRMIWVGREARFAWWLIRFCPRLYERSMIRRTLG